MYSKQTEQTKYILKIYIPNKDIITFFLEDNITNENNKNLSCFIDDIKNKNNITTDCIISYGIQRSGSALMWNILKEVFPDRIIIKTHRYIDEIKDCIIIGTYRDLRNAVVSRWRTMVLDSLYIKDQITITNFYSIKKIFEKELNTLKQFLELPNSHFIKYEELIINEYNNAFNLLEKTFNITISQITRNKIYEKLCPNSVNKLIDKYKNDTFGIFDKETHFHSKHIGIDNDYKKCMTPELITFINKKYMNDLLLLDYPIHQYQREI